MAGGRCLIRPHFEPIDPCLVRHNATMLKRDLLAVTVDNIVDGLKGCLIGNGLILGPQGRCRCGGSHLAIYRGQLVSRQAQTTPFALAESGRPYRGAWAVDGPIILKLT